MLMRPRTAGISPTALDVMLVSKEALREELDQTIS